MSQIWYWYWCLILLGIGMMIAPSLPAIAQFPTVETSNSTQVDSTFPEPIGAGFLQAATLQSGLPVDLLTQL
jgi:hypothetical protein